MKPFFLAVAICAGRGAVPEMQTPTGDDVGRMAAQRRTFEDPDWGQ